MHMFIRFCTRLGPAYDVFPGGSHNRFEHCVGVSFLAGHMVESLARRQPTLGITPVDILCVKLAGLCHDLGHGPLSHRACLCLNASVWQAECRTVCAGDSTGLLLCVPLMLYCVLRSV